MTASDHSAEPGRSRGRAKARGMRRGLVVAALLVLAASAVLLASTLVPLPRAALPALEPATPLSAVRAWGYQLQRATPERIGADTDLQVIDYSADGTEPRAYDRAAIEAFGRRGRASGQRRLVLAYLSIGEAESYRFYWRTEWSDRRPSWLGPENKDWRHNYLVRYWAPGWQRQFLAPEPSALRRLVELFRPTRQPYLDRIIEAGFDGVYLDRVDAFEQWSGERPTAERDMVEFVKAISAYAKARRPGFLVVPQNGEELLAHPDYRAAIDGVAKEDLLYGIAGDGQPNTADDVTSSLAFLAQARAAQLPVLVVEYLASAEQRFEAGPRLLEQGFVPLFAPTRQLNLPVEAAPAPTDVR